MGPTKIAPSFDTKTTCWPRDIANTAFSAAAIGLPVPSTITSNSTSVASFILVTAAIAFRSTPADAIAASICAKFVSHTTTISRLGIH